jgi:serine/threonine protein kinase
MSTQETRFGRYVIVSELGRGAMGAVHRARDPMIEREVAIKTLLPHVADEMAAEVRERFLREARSAGRLNHPGIVTIYDVGEQDGVAYIAMELLEGRSLQQMLRESARMSFATIADIIAQVAEGLDHAQQFGIVHRDVKPANIMVSAAGRAKLTDFGVARVEDSSMTQTGAALGSPKYMSPEQVLGQPIDPRSDIFSLGVVLYEMLAHRTPFERPGDTTVFALMNRIAGEKHPPVRGVDASIPAGFEAILERALAKPAAQRYSRGLELANDLRKLQNLPTTPVPSAADTDKTLVLGRRPPPTADADRTMMAPPRPAGSKTPDETSTQLIADMEDFAGRFEREEQARLRAEAAERKRKEEELTRWGDEQRKRQEEFDRQRDPSTSGSNTTTRRSAALDLLKKASAGRAAAPDKTKQTEAVARVDSRLRAAFQFLSEFSVELNGAHPVSEKPHGLLYLGEVAKVTLSDGFTDSRLRNENGKDVIDYVTFKYKVRTPGPARMQVAGPEVQKVRDRLDALRIAYSVQEQKNEFGQVLRATLTTSGPFPCQAVLRGDYENACIALDLINVRRQGPVRAILTAEEFTDDVLDEFGTYVLGVDDSFLKRLK